MAVDVSRIPNNNKFDPVREAILQLQTDIEDTGNTIGNGTLTIGTSGSLSGSGTFTANQSSNTTITIGIDDSDYLSLSDTGEQTIAGDIVISGDLTVSGTTTYINTTNLNIGDNIITLNADLPSGTAPTENAGIEINRGSATDVSFVWNETSDKWTLGSETLVAGTFEGNLTGDVTGDVTGNASTASALATARNIAVDGAVTGNADFDGSGDITITTTVNHNHDDRYYTETESDNRFVNVDGDTMTDDLNFDSGSRVRLHSGSFADANDRYEIFATGDVMFLQYYDDDIGNGTSLQKVILSLDGTGSQREATLFGDLRLKSGNVASPTYDAVVLDLDAVNGHVDITNVRNATFSGDLVVGTTNVYDGLPTGLFWDDTDDKFKIGITANGGNVSGGSLIQPLLLADILNEGYVPYVATGGGGSSIVNSRVSDSWLKLTTDTLELGASDPVSHEIRYARFLWQSGSNDKISTVYGARDITASIQYLGGSTTAKIKFTGGSGGGRIQFNDEFTFPATDGTSGQVLGTNGSGDLSWVSGAATTSDLQDVTDNGATTTNNILIGSGSAYAGTGVTSLTINNDSYPLLSLGSSTANRMALIGYSNHNLFSSANPFVFDTTSNVGIGTGASPQNKLHIKGSGTLLRLEGSTNYTDIVLTTSTNTGFFNLDNDKMAFYVGGGSGTDLKMSILNNGNVGVGTTTPDYLLDVNGTFAFRSTGYAYDAYFYAYNSTAGTYFQFANIAGDGYLDMGGAGDIIMQNNGGNVGIGTTTPVSKLQVENGDIRLQTTGSNPSIYFGSYGVSTDYPQGAIVLADDGVYGGNIDFYTKANGSATNGLDRAMRIKSNGRVGIGTTSPSYKLDVNSDSGSTISRFYNSATGAIVNIGSSANTDFADLYLETSTGNGQVFRNGTSTSYGGANSLNIYNSNGAIAFHPNNTANALFIDNNSNVGIGTISPTGTYGKLTVNGGITILDDQNAKLEIGRYSSGASNSYIKLGANSNSLLITNNNDTADIFAITNAANVALGVGTNATTPLLTNAGRGNLTVNGSADAIVTLGINGTWYGYYYATTSDLYLAHNGGNVQLQAGGSTKMYVASGGNVGIGTTSPSLRLSLGSTVGRKFMVYDDGGGANEVGGGMGVDLGGFSAETSIFFGNYGGNGRLSIGAWTSSQTYSTKATFLANGNVGIGTTSPSAKLHIQHNNSTIAFTYGTSVPNNPLHTAFYSTWSGIGMDQTTAGIRIAGDYQSNNPIVDMGYYTSGSVSHANWNSLMIVKQGGNVGIGNAGSNAKLEVTATSGEVFRADASGGAYRIVATQSGVNLNGNIGIGTFSPVSKLQVQDGDIRLQSSGSSPSIYFGSFGVSTDYPQGRIVLADDGYYGGNLDFYTKANGASTNGLNFAMRIKSNSYVGIGTTSPAFPLQVNGFISTDHSSNTSGLLIRKAGSTVGYVGQSGGWEGNTTADLAISTEASTNIRFYTNGTTTIRAFLNTSGNFCVGTTSDSGFRLRTVSDSANSASFESSGTATYTNIGNSGNTAYANLGLQNDNGYAQIWHAGSAYGSSWGGNDSLNFYTPSGSMHWHPANNANRMTLSTTGVLSCANDIIAFASDRRLKENIRPIENAIEKVKQINGVHYRWKDEVEELGFNPTQKEEVGVIAQEVEKVIPEAVKPAPFDHNKGESISGKNYKTVQYEKLVPLLIEAIKDQQKQIDELKAIINGSS